MLVSVAELQSLRGWRRDAVVVGLLGLLITICLLLVVAAVRWQAASQRNNRTMLKHQNDELQAAHHRLEGQAAKLRATAEALRAGDMLLAERTNLLNTTLQHIAQGILMVDSAGIVVVYNQRVADMLGLPETLLASRPQFTELVKYQWDSKEFSRTDSTLREFVRTGGQNLPMLYQRERPDGTIIEVRSKPLSSGGMVRTFTDITEQKRAQAMVERAAMVDELTGLPTRLALQQHLERNSFSARSDHRAALLYLSLDRFRLLNDARGHEMGDRILLEVSRRLVAACPASAFISRVGGDEFAILHIGPDLTGDELPERLLRLLAEPHSIAGVMMSITASIGVVIVEPSSSAATALRNADIALNRAKDAGRNQISHYTPSMTAAREERFQLEQSLRAAIGSHAFRLAYQPIIEVETGDIVGYEALLRWTDPMRGEISPGTFIPLAEATGLIVPLGRLVLEWACSEAASWQTRRTVAVNLSPAQFQSGDIVETVQDVLERSGLAPERLELEVTEGMLLENTGPVLQTMRALREIGVALTLDDFGAGHAGLSYLRRFPFQKMKIDGSFVRSLGRDRESDAIVEAILLLGRRLDMRVVAESVETEEQLERLRQLRCPYVQGYLTGRPMTPELARALL